MNLPLGLNASCSSCTQAAKPALSDSGPEQGRGMFNKQQYRVKGMTRIGREREQKG